MGRLFIHGSFIPQLLLMSAIPRPVEKVLISKMGIDNEGLAQVQLLKSNPTGMSGRLLGMRSFLAVGKRNTFHNPTE